MISEASAKSNLHELPSADFICKSLIKPLKLSTDHGSYLLSNKIELSNNTNTSFKTEYAKDENLSGRSTTHKPEIISDIIIDITISGIVTDSTGKPLENVTVTSTEGKGVTTNVRGEYKITASDNGTLTFSFVGFKTEIIKINKRTNINLMLLSDVSQLSDVIVVGYGTQKKVNLTGAVTQISGKVLEDRPVSNVSKALQGLIPNLNITFPSGKPGQGGQLNIRGNTSINGGAPLVLVDGVPGSIDMINSNDIESVTVLKDAAASAIYGARASFGVILVTTKQAKKGKTRISYGNNFGWSTQTQSTDFITSGYDQAKIGDAAMMSALGRSLTYYTEEDYAELEKRRNDKVENPDRPWVVVQNRNGRDQFVYYGNFDWWNFIYREKLPMKEHHASIATSGEKINYLFSGQYQSRDGILKIVEDNNKTYTFRGKIDSDLFPWLKLGNNTSFYYSKYSGGRSSSFDWGTSIDQFALPSYSPINPDGTYSYLTGLNTYTIGYGVAADMLYGKSKTVNENYAFRNTTSATIKLNKNINLVGNYTYEMSLVENSSRIAKVPYSLYPGTVQIIDRYNSDNLSQNSTLGHYQVINVYSDYQNSFGDHDIKLMAGYNQEEMKTKAMGASVNDLLSESLNDLNLGTGDKTVSGGASQWALLGLFYRVNYGYKSKYLIELDGRYDGTSRFKKGDRFGFFPSVSGGWRISEEPFFQPIKRVLNNLKFRASYGTLGNQQVSNYAYISAMNAASMNYLMNGQTTRYVNVPAAISPYLTWEKTETINFGVDASLINNKLSISFDTYLRKTLGMLTKGRTLPSVFGATEPKENAADLSTKGFELNIGWQDNFQLKQKPFSYHLGIVLSDYTSKITRFDNPSRLLNDYYVGQNLGEIWGFITDGLFKTNEEANKYPVNQDYVNPRRVQAPVGFRELQAGDLKVVDLNGDNIIGIGKNTVDDPGDRKVIGNSQARFPFGISLGANWGGISFSAFFQGIGKQDWYPGNSGIDYNEAIPFFGPYARPYNSFIPSNFKKLMWSPENPDSYFPILRGYSAQNGILNRPNSGYIQSIAYMKLRNITIGYSLPPSLINKFYLQELRVYFSGDNLFTLTNLDTKYIDPEQVASENGNSSGNVYPFSSKQFSMGVNITF